MKNHLKKVISTILTFVIMLSIITISPLQASAMTNQQGADWALARVGQWIDTDGYYGAQCKDFVNAFTQENFGVTFPGNACDLIYANLPSGWQRIQNYAEFIPEPGDIAIWGAWGSNPYGHTGIIISANLYSFESVDQNWVNSSSNGSVAARVTHNYTNPVFWGVIRPPYQSNIPSVNGAWITVNNSTFISGSTVTFNLGANHAEWYTIGINKDGTRVITQEVGTNPSFTITEPGNYTAYVTAYNSVSGLDSNVVSFRVVSPLNLGDNFYGVILNTEYWKPIGATDDNNVVLQTETGIASQLWKFERQSDSTYEIKNTKNGYNLDVVNFGPDDGTNIQLCYDNNSSAQRWYIVPNGDAYCFIPQCAINRVMDLCGNKSEDGTNIQLFSYHGLGAQTFSIYKEDSVQLKETDLNVATGTNEDTTIFNWDKTYGESKYHLNIWNGTALEGDAYYTNNDIAQNTLSAEVKLPAGYYEARIDAVNHFECKSSDIVSFTVTPKTTLIVDKLKSEIELEWAEVLNANSYTVNVYNANTDELVYSAENIEDTNYSFNIENGNYYLTVVSDNNVSSEKKLFTIGEKWYKTKIGDVNYDGYINMDDTELIMKYVVGKISDMNEDIADTSGDNRVNIVDVFALGKYLNGESNEYIGKEIITNVLLGDTNLDGMVSVDDVTYLQMHIARYTDTDGNALIDETNESVFAIADIDSDGTLTISDATALQMKLAGYNI